MKTKNSIGIISGRLSQVLNDQIQCFPSTTWKKEFEIANQLGFKLIEWVFDLSENPILNKTGRNEIKLLSKKFNIKVNSVCADYFMRKLLFNNSEHSLEKNIDTLKDLIRSCYELDIDILEIPLIDSSSIKLNENKNQVLKNLELVLDFANEYNVFLTIETDLDPYNFKNFLQKINHPNIKANYDIGNSTSMGYDPKIELSTLSPWLKNIHVKDRLHNGPTVPLGSGDVDFDLFFSQLSEINYQGDLNIQGAREDIKNPKIKPESTCKKYLKFVEQYVDKYLNTNRK